MPRVVVGHAEIGAGHLDLRPEQGTVRVLVGVRTAGDPHPVRAAGNRVAVRVLPRGRRVGRAPGMPELGDTTFRALVVENLLPAVVGGEGGRSGCRPGEYERHEDALDGHCFSCWLCRWVYSVRSWRTRICSAEWTQSRQFPRRVRPPPEVLLRRRFSADRSTSSRRVWSLAVITAQLRDSDRVAPAKTRLAALAQDDSQTLHTTTQILAYRAGSQSVRGLIVLHTG